MSERSMSGLDRETSLRLLAAQPLGRLIFSRRALPEVLLVPFRLDRDCVLIRLAAGSAAAKASFDAVVAFEADDYDPATASGWTVTVVGLGQEVVNPNERLQMATQGLRSWVDEGDDHLLAINVDRISGYRIGSAPAVRLDAAAQPNGPYASAQASGSDRRQEPR